MSDVDISTAFSDARVLVTGSGGVLGTALKEQLGLFKGTTSFFPSRLDCDLLDKDAVEAYFARTAPDIVLHLAGRVYGVQGNIDFCGLSFYENSMMNINVIEAARKAKVRKVVVAGTAAIYSDLARLPMSENDFWLGAPHGSEAAYGHAKRGMLAQLEAYKVQYGMDFAYLILTNLYGPNDRFDSVRGHVVPSLVYKFCQAVIDKADSVDIWGDGSPTRDFLYASDAARAFLFAAARGNGLYNTATGTAVPIRALVEAVKASSGFSGQLNWDSSKPLGQLQRSYDVTRIKALGWQPEIGLQEGIDLTVNWYRDNIDALRM
jgi:GDP-L-fucose synthase